MQMCRLNIALLTAVACISVVAACDRKPADRRTPRTTPTVSEGWVQTADGVRLFYRKVGDGPQAVILPGDLFLHPAFDRLAGGRTLYYYDMRNRGLSDSVGTDKALTIQQDVLDLEAVRSQLGVDSVDVVGFSYLGLMVAMYARDFPQHVRRIVQLGPVAMRFGTEYPEGLGAGDYDAAADSVQLAELRRLEAEGYAASHPKEFCERAGQVTRVGLVGNPANVTRLNADLCEKPNEWPAHLGSHFSRHFQSVQNLAVDPADFQRIAKPVLTVHGRLDRNAAYGGGREWAMTFPNARLVTIEGGAHCMWADEPERVFGAIDTFLAGAWPAGAEHVTTLARPAVNP